MTLTGPPGTNRAVIPSGGGAATYFLCDPKEEMAVIFMTQVLGIPERVRLRRELRTLVYGAMTESFA